MRKTELKSYLNASWNNHFDNLKVMNKCSIFKDLYKDIFHFTFTVNYKSRIVRCFLKMDFEMLIQIAFVVKSLVTKITFERLFSSVNFEMVM